MSTDSLGESAQERVDLTNSDHCGCCLSGAFWVKYFSRASLILGKENSSLTASADLGSCVIRRFLFFVPGFVLVLFTVRDFSCNTDK